MAQTYTSMSQLAVDLQLYVSMQQGGVYDLSLFPALAKQRYPWIVDNWRSLYTVFKGYANGDQDLEAALADFDSSVTGYKLTASGTPINALNNQDKFELYTPFLALIGIDTIGMNSGEVSLVNNEIQRVSKLSIVDFRSMLTFVKNAMTLASSSVSLYDPEGFKAVGGIVAGRSTSPTVDDLSQIDQLVELSKYIESIIVSMKATVAKPPNLLAVANANITSGSSVSIKDIYKSSVAIPFEISLEHMAEFYLGDKSLWYELVTINNLQPPYVDEVGQKFLLVAPGTLNSVAVSDVQKNNVHVGSKVGVGSVKEREESRFINKIVYNSDGTMVLYLSGDANLNKLKTTEGAYVRMYEPHTVNTGSFINIPLTIVSNMPNGLTPESDTLRRLDKSLLNFGVDIAQQANGDLSVSPSGNFALSYGLKNVRQAVLNAINTAKGELPFHRDYGLDGTIGSNMYGFDTASKMGQLITDTILKDSRITSAVIKDIVITGSSISVFVEVMIKGSPETIPLSFVG